MLINFTDAMVVYTRKNKLKETNKLREWVNTWISLKDKINA